METKTVCGMCGVIRPFGVIQTDNDGRCIICGTKWMETSTTKKMSDVARAKEYLRATGSTQTPDRVKETLRLRISHATLARKFREAAAKGELVRSYYRNERGEEIAQYQWRAQ